MGPYGVFVGEENPDVSTKVDNVNADHQQTIAGDEALLDRFRGSIPRPIAQVLANQWACSGSCQTLPSD